MDKVGCQVQDVFRDVFEDATLCIAEHITPADLDEWDSISHINLIVALEKKL